MHDEFLLEGPHWDCHEAALELSRLMKTTADEWLPDVPGLVAEPEAAWYWSKKAKQVLNSQGRIIPWGERSAG